MSDDPGPAGALMAIERAIAATIGRPIGRDENFFDAGLSSLGLVRLHATGTRGLADPFPVTALFAYPNLRALRRYLVEGETVATVAPPESGRGADGARLRRIGTARRHLRQRVRDGSERS
jgi:hypothetical protein